MSRRVLGRLRKAAGSLRSRLSNRALILMYHRVAELRSDPWSLSVTPSHFAEHLEVIKKLGRLMRVDQLAAAVARRKLPRRAVVITFDDGYADNLLNARPVLEKYDAPATVFVTTECIGSNREFWWDELDKILLDTGRLPSKLHLTIGGKSHEWGLGEASLYSEAERRARERWRAWERTEPGSRQHLYYSLWELIQSLPDSERRKVGDDLHTWASADRAARLSHLPLTLDELRRLAEGDLVEVGCHTLTHPRLSALPQGRQREELFYSKSWLEEVLGRRVSSLAYPYGRPCDYTPETIALAKEAGFDSACSTTNGIVDRRSNLFELPRFQVPDVDGDLFGNLLRQWLER